MDNIANKEMVPMMVTGLTIDPFTSMPIVILKDSEDKYALPIWIGLIEASAIATELEKIQLSRPMTHDLIKNMFEQLKVAIDKVSIYDLADNTFYAQIALKKENGELLSLEARPSDAIALALRTKAPIFVDKEVIQKSRRLDLSKDVLDATNQSPKWAEILENLTPEDFGKYKM